MHIYNVIFMTVIKITLYIYIQRYQNNIYIECYFDECYKNNAMYIWCQRSNILYIGYYDDTVTEKATTHKDSI